MRAMTIPEYGPPEVLKLQDVPEPTPAADELLIEVYASSMNPVDYKLRSGAFRAPRELPIIPGFDASGVVVGKGDAVQGFKEGDEVFVHPTVFQNGAHADRVTAKAAAAAIKPASVDHATAALLPVAVVTAWEAIHTRSRLHTGETILIQAGAGGVGHLAIQLAKAHGCTVLTTAGRDESVALCNDLGADHVINYKSQDVTATVKELTDGRGADVVFDCVGGDVFAQCIGCLAPESRLATIVGIPEGVDLSPLFLLNATLHPVFIGAVGLYNVGAERHGSILETTAEMLEAGKLTPHCSATYPLEDLVQAHHQQESQRTLGKLAIAIKS